MRCQMKIILQLIGKDKYPNILVISAHIITCIYPYICEYAFSFINTIKNRSRLIVYHLKTCFSITLSAYERNLKKNPLSGISSF